MSLLDLQPAQTAPSTVAERLRRWRERRGLTPAQLAGALGCGCHFYQRFEASQARPDVDTLTALATLGCDISWLLTGCPAVTAGSPSAG